MAKGRTVVGGRKAVFMNLMKLVLLTAVLILYMIPFFLILINSFKRKITIIKNPLMLVDPKGFSFDNYSSAFREMNYVRAFGNSLIITFVSVAFIVLFASMAAYFFARTKTFTAKFSFSLIVSYGNSVSDDYDSPDIHLWEYVWNAEYEVDFNIHEYRIWYGSGDIYLLWVYPFRGSHFPGGSGYY